jgi:hypothetical protein
MPNWYLIPTQWLAKMWYGIGNGNVSPTLSQNIFKIFVYIDIFPYM